MIEGEGCTGWYGRGEVEIDGWVVNLFGVLIQLERVIKAYVYPKPRLWVCNVM